MGAGPSGRGRVCVLECVLGVVQIILQLYEQAMKRKRFTKYGIKVDHRCSRPTATVGSVHARSAPQ